MKLKSKSKTKIIILVVIIILIVVGSITGYFVYRKNRSNKHNTENTVYLQDEAKNNKKEKYERNEIKCLRSLKDNSYDCNEFLQYFYHYDPKNFSEKQPHISFRYQKDKSNQTAISYLVNLSGIKTVNGKLRNRLFGIPGKEVYPEYAGYPKHIFGHTLDPYYNPDPTNFKLEKLNKKDTTENLYSFTFTIKPSETVKLKGIRYLKIGFKRIIISSQNGEIIYDGETSDDFEIVIPTDIQIDENDIKNNLLVKNQEYNVTFWMNNRKKPVPSIKGLKFYI